MRSAKRSRQRRGAGGRGPHSARHRRSMSGDQPPFSARRKSSRVVVEARPAPRQRPPRRADRSELVQRAKHVQPVKITIRILTCGKPLCLGAGFPPATMEMNWKSASGAGPSALSIRSVSRNDLPAIRCSGLAPSNPITASTRRGSFPTKNTEAVARSIAQSIP